MRTVIRSGIRRVAAPFVMHPPSDVVSSVSSLQEAMYKTRLNVLPNKRNLL